MCEISYLRCGHGLEVIVKNKEGMNICTTVLVVNARRWVYRVDTKMAVRAERNMKVEFYINA